MCYVLEHRANKRNIWYPQTRRFMAARESFGGLVLRSRPVPDAERRKSNRQVVKMRRALTADNGTCHDAV